VRPFLTGKIKSQGLRYRFKGIQHFLSHFATQKSSTCLQIINFEFKKMQFQSRLYLTAFPDLRDRSKDVKQVKEALLLWASHLVRIENNAKLHVVSPFNK